VPVNSATAVLRPFVLLVTATVLALGTMVALPSVASAATGSISGAVAASDPTYTPTNTVNGYPCAAGDRSPHYRVIQARIVGTSASVLTAKVTPSGFRASLGVYDGVFLPDQPVVNCYGTFVGGSSGAPITYTISTPDISQFPGITERSYFFVVAGYTASDVGSFSVSVESTNASAVIVTDATPKPADTTKPVLSGLTDRTVEATGAPGAAVTFAPTATDDVDGSRPVTCSPASGSTFTIGTTSVSCSATDRSSNKATGSFTVSVQDTTKPALSGLTDLTREPTSSAGAVVTFAPTAVDVVDGSRPVSCSPASGSTFVLGTTKVTCSASDTRNNVATGSFSVVVGDTTKPVLGGLTDRTAEATSAAGAAVTFAPTATATDAVDGSRTVSCSPTSGSIFALGTTKVTCSASDTAGNTATGSFDVLVRDTVKPVVTVPADVRRQATGDDGAAIAYTSSATDGGSGIVPASTTCSRASGSLFPVGTTTVTCSAEDNAGNQGSASFIVTVYRGTFVVDGAVVISGDAKVGKTLTATSTVTTTPAASTTTGQWLRDGVAIASATGPTYVLTGADLGATLTYRQTDARSGYDQAVSTSNAIGPVAKGEITLARPTIGGTAQVGRTLTAEPGTVAPTQATQTYEWFSGTDSLGTGTTYVVKAADRARTIQLRATAALTDYTTTSALSDATQPVAAGVLVVTGDVTVSGSAKVGQTLSATSTVATSPASDAPTGQWFRGTEPVAGATAATYVLSNADAGSQISYTEARTKTAYETVTTSSTPTEKISGGFITVADPVITGRPVVDQVLSAKVSAVDPADATTSFAWFVGGQQAGTGADYAVKPSDVGSTITVKSSSTKQYFDTVLGTSTATVAVDRASFITGPTAAITGVFKVGEELTAETGAPSPVQDSFTYTWFADGAPVTGATGRTLTLKAAQKNQRISVRVSAQRAGYVTATDTSDVSAAVVTDLAPALSLTPSATDLRLGQSVTLAWTSLDATSVVASGAWSGSLPTSGSQQVTPSETGTATYTLTASNGAGTTTAQVAVPVALAPQTLGLGARSSVRSDRSLRVRAYRLAPGEQYTIRLGGAIVSTGRATSAGRVDDAVRVPSSVDAGRRVLRVTGSLRDRTAARTVRVVEVKKPRIVLADSSVRASDRQRVRISRLLPGERVTVMYQGKRVSKKSARADRKGVLTMTFNVGTTWGDKTVKVVAGSDKRSSSRTFTVVNRCPQGGYYCR
jgi:hypothetical protein